MKIYFMIIALIIVTVLSFMIYTQHVTIEGMDQRTSINITLLGDSMLNNTRYVPSDKTVDAFLKITYPDTILLAKDETKIKEVQSQLNDVSAKGNENPKQNQFIFLSAGGNDIMNLIDKHGAPAKNEKILERLSLKVDGIFSEYMQLVEVIQKKFPAANLGLLNIYYPVDYSFDYNTDPQIIKDLITYWNQKLSAKFTSFKKNNTKENKPLLIEVDRLLKQREDFINHIEPSITGGKKIASQIGTFIQINGN